jgi:hypothetical protein
MFVRVVVDDYDVFRAAYDAAEPIRRKAGSTGNTVYRSVENSNEVTVRIAFPSLAVAKEYSASAELRECMKEVGVQGTPAIWFADET